MTVANRASEGRAVYSHTAATFRRGVSLIELLVAMLILALVCVAWLEIIGIQSARKEARRREAVERLAGMMDAFMQMNQFTPEISAGKYCMNTNGINKIYFEIVSGGIVRMFGKELTSHGLDDVSPIGYILEVTDDVSEPFGKYNTYNGKTEKAGRCLIGKLYNHADEDAEKSGNLFFSLPVGLGWKR